MSEDASETLLQVYLVNTPQGVEVAVHIEDCEDWTCVYLRTEEARTLAKHIVFMCDLTEKVPQDPGFLDNLPLE